MSVFNMLMFASFVLMIFVLVVTQVYILVHIIKELIRDKDFGYFVCLLGIIGTSLATIGLLVGVTSMIFTGGTQ